MTADQCEACPFPDQTAALELVRLREGIRGLCETYDEAPTLLSGADEWTRGWLRCLEQVTTELRALLDDNEGER